MLRERDADQITTGVTNTGFAGRGVPRWSPGLLAWRILLTVAAMLQRNPPNRLQALDQHAKLVRESYSKACENLQLYPEQDRGALLDSVNRELSQFEGALEMARAGKFVRQVQAEVAHEARSWLYGAVPSSICRYANLQRTAHELREREDLSQERIAVCHERRALALNTLKRLKAFDGNPRTEEAEQIKQDCDRFVRAFELYRRGVSWKEIRRLTGESMQSRIQEKTLPDSVTRYGGYPLSRAATRFRETRGVSLLSATAEAVETARTRVLERSPSQLAERESAWAREMQELRLAVALYVRGLSVKGIGELTGLPTQNWILDQKLPQAIARSSLDLSNRSYRMPTCLDEKISYVVGAIFGGMRLFSRDHGLFFRHEEAAKVYEMRGRLMDVFGAELPAPTKNGSRHVLQVSRTALVKDLFERLGIAERSTNPLPPFALLRYPEHCLAFLEGFFQFCSAEKDLNKMLVAVGRTEQENIIKAVACALYLEGIFPLIAKQGNATRIIIRGVGELSKLNARLPGLFSPQEQQKIAKRGPTGLELTASVPFYRSVMRVIEEGYPRGTPLVFDDVVHRAAKQLSVPSPAVTRALKGRIQGWRRGIKPLAVKRAEALEDLILGLYPKRS